MKRIKELIRRLLIIPGINKLVVSPIKIFSRVIPLKFFERIPVVGIVKHKLPDGKCFKMVTDGLDPIASVIFWRPKSNYRPEVTRLYPQILRDKKNIFDIGANTGVMSILFSLHAPSANIFSFEPVPDIFKRLEKNIAINRINNCRAYQIAIGNNNGYLPFYVPKVTAVPSSSSLKPGFRPDCYEITVPASTLDSFVAENNIETVDFVKIDVESKELDVLKGMIKTMERFSPDIICEILSNAEIDRIFSLLTKFGYNIYNIQRNHLKHIITPDEVTICLPYNFYFSKHNPKEINELNNAKD